MDAQKNVRLSRDAQSRLFHSGNRIIVNTAAVVIIIKSVLVRYQCILNDSKHLWEQIVVVFEIRLLSPSIYNINTII